MHEKDIINELCGVICREMNSECVLHCNYPYCSECKRIANAIFKHYKPIIADFMDKLMRGCGDDKEFWVVKLIIKQFGVDLED